MKLAFYMVSFEHVYKQSYLYIKDVIFFHVINVSCIFQKKKIKKKNLSGGQSEYCDSPTDEVVAALEKNGINFVNTAVRGKTKKGKPKMGMRIDIPATTPTKTIAAVTTMLWEDLVNNPKKAGGGEYINRKKIQCAEKMIRGAFVELYRGLGLLKTYRCAYFIYIVRTK